MAFLNGLLLWGTALGSVPVIIHLLNKQRFRPVKWAAMEFLLEALKQNSRRIQIRDIIMMLIRTLAVILLALALARPTIASNLNVLGAGSNTCAVILLDNSLSMGYSNGKENRFNVAKRRTREILALMDRGTWCKVITFNSQAGEPLGDPSRNLQYVDRELDKSVYLADGGTDIEAGLRKTKYVFENHPEFKIATKEIYLLTDLQERAWSPKHVSKNFNKLLDELSKEAAFYIIDAGDAGIENAALIDIKVSDPLAVVDMPITVTADIHNFGQADINGLTVDFFVDGEKDAVKRSTVDMGPGERSSVDFETQFKVGGDHKIEVRLGDDRLQEDNHRFVTIEVMDEARFLLVDGRMEHSDDPLSGEAGFLSYALSPTDIDHPDRKPVFQSEIISPHRLSEKNLSTYQAVALCNVEKVPQSVLKVLESQVRAGLGLLIFLGDQTDPQSFNALMGKEGVGLLPAEIEAAWGEVPKVGEKVEKTPDGEAKTNYRTFAGEMQRIAHPVMAFFNQEDARPLLNMVQIFKAYNLNIDKGDGVNVVAFYDNGDPAIVERRLGGGRVVLFPFPATTLDTKGWSNLPAHYVFPIVMNRIAASLALGNRPKKNLEAGDAIIGHVSLADQRLSVQVHGPLQIGKQETQPEPGENGVAVFEFGVTDKAGFYDISLERPGFQPMVYSINSPAKIESALERTSPKQIRMDYPNFKFTFIGMGDDPAGALVAERRGTEIWPWLLILVFALLALESVLAYLWAPRD